MKTCTRCGEVKELSEFPHRKSSRDGTSNHCKKCHKLRREKFLLNHPNYESDRAKRRREIDPEIMNNYSRLRYRKNPNYHRERSVKQKESLTLGYIATVLKISKNQVSEELFELKRAQLEMYRLTKQLNKEIQNGTK